MLKNPNPALSPFEMPGQARLWSRSPLPAATTDSLPRFYIRFDDLEVIGADIRQFKDYLRTLVDEQSGVGDRAGIEFIRPREVFVPYTLV